MLAPINFPLTFETYVNSGFIICGTNSLWNYTNFVGYDTSLNIRRDNIYGDIIAAAFYIIPTSQNCSLTLYYNEEE